MTMKKLTAMFLSLLICFSLLAVTAQAAYSPDDSSAPGAIGSGEISVIPGDGDEDPDEPGVSVQSKGPSLPNPRDEVPTD